MNSIVNKLKRVELHPATIKHISGGHFWVTEDSFTKKFPKSETFLIGVDSKSRKDFGLFIQDLRHKNVKARLFSKDININFDEELKIRINEALNKRKKLNLLSDRENILLINGEADNLPGLLIMLLKDQILIQYYALYWDKFETKIISNLKNSIQEVFPELSVQDFWIQERTFDQKKSIKSLNNSPLPEFVLNEFGVKYKMRINAYYDYGIYTDMSGIRKQILNYISGKKSMLNLFCYTGAYSLFALKNGFTNVKSVDLSPKYLEWLEENIALNSEDWKSKHQSINLPVEKALDKLIKEGEKFDFIFTDPPSSSSDGEKRDNAFTAYEKNLPMMLKLLNPNGVLIAFLNTHQISWNKFEDKLKTIIENSEFKNQVVIGKRFKLCEDYLPPKGFHEGDYLKGFLIEFKGKGN